MEQGHFSLSGRSPSCPGRKALYQAEYLGMAVEFQQFFVLERAARTRMPRQGQIRHLAQDQRTWFELISRAMYSLDLGMQGLAEAIARLPRPALTGAAGSRSPACRPSPKGCTGPTRTSSSSRSSTTSSRWTTPGHASASRGRSTASSRRRYRVVRYDGKDVRLEDEDAWSGHKVARRTSAHSSCGTSSRRTACGRRC